MKYSNVFFAVGFFISISSLPTLFFLIPGGALNVLSCIIALPILLLLLILNGGYKFPCDKLLIVAQVCLIFIYFLGVSVSLVSNDFFELFASAIRYFSYFIFFIVAYNLSLSGHLTIKKFDKFIVFLVMVLLFFSVYQILSGTRPFMNGAYRLSSIFGPTPAGFALVLLFCSIYLWHRRNVARYYEFLFISSVAMVLLVHSRQAIVTVFISIFLILFLKSKLHKKIAYLLIFSLFVLLFYWVVLNTDFLPRFTDMLTRDGVDGSTLTRIRIFETVVNSLDYYEKVFGVGLGGFNHFYGDITGKLGVAAHNDFLLFYIETGAVGLILYVIYLFTLLLFSFRRSNENTDRDFKSVMFVLYVSFPVMSFINNPYYYPQVQWLILTFIGILLGHEKRLRCKANA